MGFGGFLKKLAIGVKHVTHIIRQFGLSDIFNQSLHFVRGKQRFTAIQTDSCRLIRIIFDQLDNTVGVTYRIRVFEWCSISGTAPIGRRIESDIDTALAPGLTTPGHRKMDIERKCFSILEFYLIPAVDDKSIVGAEIAQSIMVNDLWFAGLG